MNGNFIISLDFELFWGVSESRTINDYRGNLERTAEVVDRILVLFRDYNISATWACVGFLFFDDKLSFKKYIDMVDLRPSYTKRTLSNYDHAELIKNGDEDLYFARDILKNIAKEDGQEIASHTFSHFYTLENGTNIAEFTVDMLSALDVADDFGVTLESIVFPRNQYNKDILNICKELGFKSYRGNPDHFIYRPSAKQGILRRSLRLLDAYIPITGNNTFLINRNDDILNVRASRFLRPYNSSLKQFENLRVKRLLNEMTFAAVSNKNYHLWWHPHNFGTNLNENLEILEKILSHYKMLNKMYDFQSRNMKYFTNKVVNN